MPVQTLKVFSKKLHKKADDNNITDRFTLLLSCRLFVLCYVIKYPLKQKVRTMSTARNIGAITLARTFIPFLYLVCFYTSNIEKIV